MLVKVCHIFNLVSVISMHNYIVKSLFAGLSLPSRDTCPKRCISVAGDVKYLLMLSPGGSF